VAERHVYRSDDDLGAALRSLATHVSYPETPDLASGVLGGIRADSSPPVRSLPVRRWLAVAAVLLVLLLASVLIYPDTRSTVAGWFNVPGITIFVEDEPVETPVVGLPLQLGDRVTLDEARTEAGFDLLVPGDERLGEPDEVYVSQLYPGVAASFVYHAGVEIPETEQTGVGVLLTQFQGTLNPGTYGKGVPEGVSVEYLEVNGHDAYWLSGKPHTLYYAREGGVLGQQDIRMAGNTLLWQHGDITLRLESALDLDTVLDIAGSMR
jgi:hypothetical protein